MHARLPDNHPALGPASSPTPTRRCPISYEPIADSADYSPKGLRKLDRNLTSLQRLPSLEEQRREVIARAGKMSIQGIQPKLSAVLRPKAGRFEFVDRGGKFILKPQSHDFIQLPENEDVTMRLAAAAEIEVPLHGLLWASDGSLTYFIRRFDRVGRRRISMEDFAQLTSASRDTKYNSSMERVAEVIQRTSYPTVQGLILFKLTLFSFLVGNEDMHLKNFSLVERDAGVFTLSPAYDLVSSTLAMPNAREEMALPIRGKKRGLGRKDLVSYFGGERLGLNDRVLETALETFAKALPKWSELIDQSFLSQDLKRRYHDLVKERWSRLS